MARLKKERVAIVNLDGEEVRLTLREPSNEELNEFLSSRFEVGKRGAIKDNAHEKRSVFFDTLLTGVDNLEDAEGVTVTPERKELIPANWKGEIIIKLFEASEINIKNS